MDTYKQENGTATHLIGQEWQKLIDLIDSRPDDSGIKSFDGGGSLFHYRAEESVFRTLQDVKRLRQKDMPLFGRCPETDNFYTVVCSLCSMILMPFALKDHWEKRHSDSKSSSSPNEKQNVDSPGKSKSKKSTPVKSEKVEKIEKSKKAKSSSVSETTSEEVTKDSKRLDKSKKGKTTDTKPSEPDVTAAKNAEKGKPKSSRHTPDLQPIVALSPILVAEGENETNEGKDSKNKKKDKKKNDRKPDKIYDPDKHCGVVNDSGKPCVRSILCKVHQVALKRAVGNRTMPYDTLIRILKNQNEEEKIKAENGSLRVVKTESGDKPITEPTKIDSVVNNVQSSNVWPSEDFSIKLEEPPAKRLKIRKEIVEEDVDQNQFTLPSHLEALIDETLKTLKDEDEGEPLPIIPVVSKSEPVLKWSFESETPPKSPSPPPHIVLDDIHWHSSHPKPLATNTFGCRLIGGLMSTCKKLDTLRKHLQSVWASSAPSMTPMRSSFSDVYNSNNSQNSNSSSGNSKNSLAFSKYVKKSNQSKGTAAGKKNLTSVATKNSSAKRKQRSNSNVIAPIQNPSSNNSSDIISGLVINSVPLQRTGSSSVPTIPTGVIPVNSITGNGVPLRLFQGSLPFIASATHNQPATFIHLNLCPPK